MPTGRRHRRSPRTDGFASERDGSDGALDRVVVELDTTVIEEAGEGGPAPECVADGLGEGAGGRNAAKLPLEPGLHQLGERPGADVTHMPTLLCGAAPDRTPIA